MESGRAPTGRIVPTARSIGCVTQSISTDVLVVGAGPAGTAAAIELARAGRDVAIIDKAVFPRDKCCGDGLTTLALRELEHLGLDPATIPDWFDVDGAAIRSPSGREVCVPLARPGSYAAVAPRLQLDDALVALARDGGADVRDGIGFDRIVEHDDHVDVVEADDLDDRRPLRRRRRRHVEPGAQVARS